MFTNFDYKKINSKKDALLLKYISHEKIKKKNFLNTFNISKKNILHVKNDEKLNSHFEKIVYVYQEKYTNNKSCTGFGDFLRGFYFLIQFCEDNNYNYNLIINHPISKYLNFKNNVDENILSQIDFFDIINFDGYVDNNGFISYKKNNIDIYKEFKTYLNNLPIYNNTVYVYCINLPNKIHEKHKKIMKYFIKPSIEMDDYINEIIQKESLNNYNVLHIRCGDDFLIHNFNFQQSHGIYILNNLLKDFENINMNHNVQWLIISDNNIIKNLLVQKYPFLKMFHNEIIHIGENIYHDDIKIKNTILDFYLISKAKHIFSFTVYKHGSGFSKWCAETYNIPYICRYIGL